MTLRRKKSRKAKAADAVSTFLKVKVAGKAAKATRRTPIVRRVPLIVAGAVAAVFVAIKARGGGDEAVTA